jgi:hypothetical protein
MQKWSVAAALVLVLLFAGFAVLAAPGPTGAAGPAVTAAPVHAVGHALPLPAAGATRPNTAPVETFPRTIMVESFTAQWCPHCPSESHAMYNIVTNSTPGTIINPELHACATSSYCGDDYIATDNVEFSRMATEGVTGFPTVIIDGGPYSSTSGRGFAGSCAAGYSSQVACIPVMQSLYANAIANASAYPGNVSITQQSYTSFGGANTVTVQGNITSGVSGTYQVITYLVQHINKWSNKYDTTDPNHFVGDIVWRSLYDENVTLTAGGTVPYSGTKALLPSWDLQNLSVVTFVQQNGTLWVQNANESTTSTAAVSVTPAWSPIASTQTVPVAIRVVNGTTGTPVVGASVTLNLVGSGTLGALSGVTAAGGYFNTTYSGPSVTGTNIERITAEVTGPGILPALTARLIAVQPTVAPLVPRSLAIAPAGADGQTSLSWSPPISGGVGLTYHIYRSGAATGPFSQVGTSTSTNFTDSSLTNGPAYWYQVAAQGPGGFSANTTAMEVSSVVATTSGLANNVGWWLEVNAWVINSTSSGAISLHLPAGVYSYNTSSFSYSYLPSQPSGSLTVVAGAANSLTVQFSPNYAVLSGQVSPASAVATVLFNGTPATVKDGAFSEVVFAGTYSVSVSAPGYADNNTSVTLTPGNQSSVTFLLNPLPSSSSGSSTGGFGGLSEVEVVGLAAIVVIAVIGTVAAVVWSGRRRRSPPSS